MISDPAPPGAVPSPEGSPGTLGWQGIRDVMMDRIRARHYAPGALIPNEADLAAEFGCARATVNRALRELAEAGFLDRRRKAGTRVIAEPRRKATLEIPLIRAAIEGLGAAYSFRLLTREIAPPPPEVRAALRLEDDVPLLHVVTLHLADAVPHMVEDRWVVLATVPAIEAADLTRDNPNEWLVRNAPYSEGTMRCGAALAGAMASHLGCTAREAVLVVERATWLDGAPITLARQHYAPAYGLTLAL